MFRPPTVLQQRITALGQKC